MNQKNKLVWPNAAAKLGYHSIKTKQRAAIEAFVADEKDVFCLSAYRLREVSVLHSSALGV